MFKSDAKYLRQDFVAGMNHRRRGSCKSTHPLPNDKVLAVWITPNWTQGKCEKFEVKVHLSLLKMCQTTVVSSA